MKRVLVACEYSGVVRDAFLRAGHEAYSCDIIPGDPPSPFHIQGDVVPLLKEHWDLIIAHPPCTYLCNSGVRGLHTDPGRWELLDEAAKFFRLFLNVDCERVCIENPVMHKHARQRIGGVRRSQVIQPWQFGHGETKATCLWLKNLPRLEPTNIVSGREARIHKMGPSPDRGKLRSKTYEGIGEAMAQQWGPLL